jgi:hypothetical protein
MGQSTGYLLIADISGYTAYLTSTEQDHASGVIAGLLESLVERLVAPLHLWRIEGDAVLAYTTDPDFPDGHTFLTICEDLYNAFIARRLDIHTNSSCDCKACARVPELDLKVILHHGTFQEMVIGPMRDISGSDAILVHRMTKTGVREATGIKSYALVSQAAFDAMGAPAGLVPYAESMDHFGEVSMQAYDLGAARERLRAARKRAVVEEKDALWTVRVHLPLDKVVAWEIIISARSRRQWMDMINVTVETESGRPEPGARFHCVHKIGEFTSWLVDWEPFDYFTIRYVNAYHPHLSHYETYTLTPQDDGGVELRYTMGSMFNPDEPEAGPFPDEDIEYRDMYIELMSPWFESLEKQAADDPSAYA